MQADNVHAGAKDLCRKLVDLNPLEAHAAVNQYFDTAASLESREVNIQGAARIKKQFDLVNHAFAASDLVGEPDWSERDQTINFTYTRLIQTPELPWPLNSLPLVSQLSQARKTIHYDGSLHLNPEGNPGEGEVPNLLVTKYIVNRREQAPLENLIPYTVLRPFLSILSNVIATVASIVLAFPFTPKGIVYMISSLINNFWLWFYDKVADGVEGHLPQKPSWAEGPGADLPVRQQLGSVLSTAEDQAKKLGIPVERAKKLAQEAYERGGSMLEQVQGKAKEGVKKADQIGQDVNNEVQDGIRAADKGAKEKAETAVKETVERGRKMGKGVKGKAQETKENVETAAKGIDDLPRTPLGGHDPLADGAPSYADAAASEAGTGSEAGTESEQATGREQATGSKQGQSDLPSTPFGGTDPLADGAPTYAEAAEK